jgi:hypothetical protein
MTPRSRTTRASPHTGGSIVSGVDESNSAARADQLPSDAAHNRWRKAIEEHAEKLFVAKHFKKRAKEKLEKAKLAKRLYDAKMRRLQAGDKLKRRKKTFGAARRTYEAIIDLQTVQYDALIARCAAAEAETDACKAQLRVEQLENALAMRA